jgi:antibiotic biosynthesis monooxygenase (ABM) superfamily enzyme
MSPRPGTHLRALATWLAVYPLITAVLALAEPLLRDAPLPVQTLVLTAVVVPIAVYAAVPLLLRLLTGGVAVRPSGTHDPAVVERNST